MPFWGARVLEGLSGPKELLGGLWAFQGGSKELLDASW